MINFILWWKNRNPEVVRGYENINEAYVAAGYGSAHVQDLSHYTQVPELANRSFLQNNPNIIFVFGDNGQRTGRGGAANLRDEPNTYGFITKKAPNNHDASFYRPDEYKKVFDREMQKLIKEIEDNPNKVFLISRMGSGLANRYGIYHAVVHPNLHRLIHYKNVAVLDPSVYKTVK